MILKSLLLLVTYVINSAYSLSSFPLLLIVSFDGFRHDYFNMTATPNFDKFKSSGIYVPEMKNVFVTQTFPNHFTIATGRYEEDHGVVGNNVYDPLLEKYLNAGTPELFNYDSSVMPLWSLNEMKEGRHSGSMMWIGGDHMINGIKNTYAMKLDKSMSFYKRVDKVMEWFTAEERPANLVFMYYEEPDSVGHIFGPNSIPMKNEIKKIDHFVGYLMTQVNKMGLENKLNIILTTDHGMTSLKPGRIEINKLIDLNKIELSGTTPVVHVRVKPSVDKEAIYQELKSKEQNNHYKVYRKKDIPERFHYKNNRRVMDIVLMADYGYEFNIHESVAGNHGYDNNLSEMHGFLMASGPRMIVGQIENFTNVDIYPMACHILGLQPYPNNGTLHKNAFRTMMNTFPSMPYSIDKTHEHYVIIAATIGAVLVCTIGAVIAITIKRHKLKPIDK